MPKSVEKTGKTVDEAVQDALAELGCSIDDVVIDVLDEGDSGILGIGRKPARVLVTLDELSLQVPSGRDADEEGDGQYDFTDEGIEAADVNDPGMLDDETYRESLEEEFVSDVDGVEPDETEEYFGDDSDPLSDQNDELAGRAIDFLEQVFAYMDIPAEFSASSEDDHISIDIDGEDVGAVIGRRGDTLNALQYLASLVVNKESTRHVYLSLDIAGYRRRREKQLTDMAKRTARRVIEVGKDYVMEPMPAAERRIIHTALQDYPGIRTESEGTEPNRSVVLIPTDRS